MWAFGNTRLIDLPLGNTRERGSAGSLAGILLLQVPGLICRICEVHIVNLICQGLRALLIVDVGFSRGLGDPLGILWALLRLGFLHVFQLAFLELFNFTIVIVANILLAELVVG